MLDMGNQNSDRQQGMDKYEMPESRAEELHRTEDYENQR